MRRSKSKDLIAMALFDEMIETHISEVTITSLINRSQIARRTFYNNFENFYQVITYLINLIDDELNMPNLYEDINYDMDKLQDMINYLPERLYEHRDLLRVIYTTDLRGF